MEFEKEVREQPKIKDQIKEGTEQSEIKEQNDSSNNNNQQQKNPFWINLFTVAVAVVSLIFSIYVGVYQGFILNEQKNISERQVKLLEKQADTQKHKYMPFFVIGLSAAIDPHTSKDSGYMQISIKNAGEAAYNLNIETVAAIDVEYVYSDRKSQHDSEDAHGNQFSIAPSRVNK